MFDRGELGTHRAVRHHHVAGNAAVLRGTLGAINFEILRNAGAQVLTVDDTQAVAAMRLLWTRTKQLLEPSSATVLAAVLANPALFARRRVGIILSGGNVDLDALPALFALAGDAQP